jgi:glucose-6-phosphate isomerase
MTTTDFDPTPVRVSSSELKRLDSYRSEVAALLSEGLSTRPETVLSYPTKAVVGELTNLAQKYPHLRQLIVLGIGGSSLGLEAVHEALGKGRVELSVIDMISPPAITALIAKLKRVKKVSHLAVCIISKSGTTTETIANASVLLRILADLWGTAVYKQTFFIGDAGAPLVGVSKKLGAHYWSMPAHIGGRFSVATEVGLLPLSLLGHNVSLFAEGLRRATSPDVEKAVALSSLRLYTYLKSGVRHYNFFAFDHRLAPLGAWYRQLAAESLGKATDKAGKAVTLGFVPTISTPVELHSIGQLYLSGFKGVYTEFLSLDDSGDDYMVGPTVIAPALKKFTLGEISTALYGGVVAAYRSQKLPYHATVLSNDLPLALGEYMGSRMLETIYLAHLMNINAFDQPNVELYKQKTRSLLGL